MTNEQKIERKPINVKVSPPSRLFIFYEGAEYGFLTDGRQDSRARVADYLANCPPDDVVIRIVRGGDVPEKTAPKWVMK
jgi:hypothetical protein